MNTSVAGKEKFTQLPVAMLVAEIIFILTIVLNIAVARQVIGFFFLTFVPGFAILRLTKLKLEMAEQVVFAAGLSIAFLMGVGLFTNFLGPLFGLSQPLALIPLMSVINVIVLLLLFFEWRDHEVYRFSVGYKKLAPFVLVICVILALSVVGALLVNIPPHNNNLILLFVLVFISVLLGIAVFSKRLVPPEFYPLTLFAIAIALLFPVSLFSSYIHGGDIFTEYLSFKITSSSSYWNPTISSRLYSMLSVTILPTIYSNILGLGGTWILKIVYPLIFALVPVGVFQLFKSKFGKEVAFFSAIFFVSNLTFFTEIVTLARQMVGELFFILLFLTIFSKNVKGYAKWLCFFIFSFGLVVSHYALSYIFLIFIFAFWLLSFIMKRKMSISAGMVFTFAVMTFAWYIYSSSSSTFNSLLSMANNIKTNFASDFFTPQSRGSSVLQATGLQSGVGTFWHVGGTYLYYVTELLIIVGLLSLLLKQRSSFFNDEYNIMLFLNMGLLAACIVVPNLATTFNASRFYQLTLFFLAPLCVIGGMDILRFLSRKRLREKYILAIVILAVIIPFFLFQTDFVYEVAREESVSLPLSSYRFSALTLANMGVVEESEVSSATWLAQFGNMNSSIYADITSGVLFEYVGIQNSALFSLGVPMAQGSYVYLMEFNVLDGVVFTSNGPVGSFNLTQIVPSLNETNLIFSSGSCEIYKALPTP
jgi:uncharacterized membrane protein